MVPSIIKIKLKKFEKRQVKKEDKAWKKRKKDKKKLLKPYYTFEATRWIRIRRPHNKI
jgi:hypothetical protein